MFDHQEHCLVALSDMRDACLSRDLHRTWAEHPEQLVRVTEVGFDPAGHPTPTSTATCGGGWPTTPQAGTCDYLIDLLRYMCAGDSKPEELFQRCSSGWPTPSSTPAPK